MKQTIPFTKDITFKTKIGEITSISLENDLMLKGEDLISGNFYISGTYKMLETSTIEETYSYKVPCEIAISDDYDTFDASVDIEDFNYEIVDDEIMRVNIVVEIDNLKKKELPKEEKVDEDIELLEDSEENRCYDEEDETKEEKTVEVTEKAEEKEETIKDRDNDGKTTSFLEVKESIEKQNDNYLTYKVYIYKEGDSIEKILDTYKITKDDLSDYNNLEDIVVGSKIVIPSFND